jgi:hypothetical protein
VEDAPREPDGSCRLLVEVDRVVVTGRRRVALRLIGRHVEGRLARLAGALAGGHVGRGLAAVLAGLQAAEQLRDVLLGNELPVGTGLGAELLPLR